MPSSDKLLDFIPIPVYEFEAFRLNVTEIYSRKMWMRIR